MPSFRSVIGATAAVAAGAAAAIATVAAGTVVLPVAAVGAAAGAAIGLAGGLAGGATGIAVAKYLDQPNGAQINNPSSSSSGSSSGSSSSTSSSSPTNNDPDNMSVQYTRVAVEGATAGGAKTRFFNELDERGFTGAHSAIELDDAESLKSALEQLTPAERVMNLSKQNKRGHSCFHMSAICKSVKTLEVMIEQIPKDELYSVLAIKDNNGSTCLHWAAYQRCDKGLDVMLSAIAPEERPLLIQVVNEFGETALHWSAAMDFSRANISVLNSLDKEDRRKVNTSRKHQPEYINKVISVLLQSLEPPQAFNLVRTSNNEGKTVIHVFAEENIANGIECILTFFDVDDKISIVSVRDKNGQLAVHIAAEKDHEDALQYLLKSFHWKEYLLHTVPTALMFCMTTDRPGAEEEFLSLKTSFLSIDIPPSVYRDPNRFEVLNAIRDSHQQQSRLSALIVVTMSHGDGISLILRDGEPIAVQDIINEMDQIPPEIPKVLIIQACRGQGEQRANETDATPVEGTGSVLPERFHLKQSNFVVICSCVHDNVSYRNVFIPYLAEQLNRSQENDNIHDLFLNVSNLINTCCSLTPEYNTTMTKHLQLKNKQWRLGTSF